MTEQQLTDELALRVMQWTATCDHFLTGKRGWVPPWRFGPTENITNALRLLTAATLDADSMGSDQKNAFWASVVSAGVVGTSGPTSQGRALTLAIAHALRLEIDELE